MSNSPSRRLPAQPRLSARRPVARSGASTLAALLFRAQEYQGGLAMALMTLVLAALAVAAYVPVVARDFAIVALLITAPLVAFLSARWAWNERGGLRLAALTVAVALTLVAVASLSGALFAQVSLLGSSGLVLVALLGGAAAVVQIWAERRHARSWLLVGAGVVTALAAYGPLGFEAASPAESALRILAVAFVAGGGGGVALSYLIARAHEPAPR